MNIEERVANGKLAKDVQSLGSMRTLIGLA